MLDRFFVRALEAASKGPDFFAAEFENKDADANAVEYRRKGEYGYSHSLIHAIIQDIPDEQLPAFLKILIQYGVNLEAVDSKGMSPLALAAQCGKKNAVNFLIENKVNINPSTYSPLCAVMDYSSPKDESDVLDIVKILIEHHANINHQDPRFMSPLIHSARCTYPKVMAYLLSKDANLFLTYTYFNNGENYYQTALGVAYDSYTHSLHTDSEAYKKRAKLCLDILVKATIDYLYREGFQKDDVELFINNTIIDLSGKFIAVTYVFAGSSSEAVKKLLEDTIKPAEFAARIKEERIERTHAFGMGAIRGQAQTEMKAVAPIYKFFQNDGKHDLTREIFSYVHPVKKLGRG